MMISKKPIAVVTGSSGFLGREICKRFHEDGYIVLGIDQILIENNFCDGFIQIDLNELVCNLVLINNILSLIESYENAGFLRVLINNAAYQFVSHSHPISLNEMSKSVNVNALAPYYLTTTLAGRLASSKGLVVNISSIHARLTKAGFTAYSSTKAMLSALTRSLAIEYGGRFQIICVEPAAIDTGMLREGFVNEPDKLAVLNSYHPSGRIGTVEEVAKFVAMICMSNIEFLHGACIDISGGIAGRLHDPN
jgi:NAD(P)-dependent dehydrogenase (short-subunit alcohol dehydrogenase family)